MPKAGLAGLPTNKAIQTYQINLQKHRSQQNDLILIKQDQ